MPDFANICMVVLSIFYFYFLKEFLFELKKRKQNNTKYLSALSYFLLYIPIILLPLPSFGKNARYRMHAVFYCNESLVLLRHRLMNIKGRDRPTAPTDTLISSWDRGCSSGYTFFPVSLLYNLF